MREERFLRTTSYVVLGLLSFGRELTGYELKQWADESIAFFFASPAMSQIYTELDRLEAAGFVRGRDASRGADRSRCAYRLTARGTRELARWVDHAPVAAPALKHTVALRLFLGHVADPARLRAILDEHLERTRATLAALEKVRADLGDDETWRFPALVADWGERYLAGEADAVAAAARRVRRLPRR
jgi:DNA-binding PadR family transcriptional regulator